MRFFLLLLLCLSLLPNYSLSLNNEGRYLMDVKNGLEDPSNMLANWDERDRTPCNWTGITCTTTTSPSEVVVTSVDLTNYGLIGPFPASLCRLPNLSFLSLQLNFINGSLTNASLSSCTTSPLLHLDLSLNLLVGPLPDSLPSHLPLLRHLDLSSNNFTGPIPPSFALFPRLHNLTLVYNLLTSPIPSFLANISTLRNLSLSYNLFDPGTIPPSFANLSSLQVLWLAGCALVGSIPPALGTLASLTTLDLTYNSLSGHIPTELTGLASIVQIELYNNSLSGPFPSGFSNLTALRRLDASLNHLDGPLPADLFDIPLLESLHLYQNRISGKIPPGVSRSRSLVELRLFGNSLTGTLPADLGTNSPLMFVDLADNQLSGEIPASICDRGLLQEVLLLDNSFSGTVPYGLARCQTLTRVRLSNNNFSGDIPPGLWGLPHVWLLGLHGNSFSGPISPTISGAHNLSMLTMSDNRFSGSIPPEIGHLPSLYKFSAANNELTGPIPASLGSMTQLGQLDLHNNSLTGGLLTNINSWTKLALLNLADNDLTGTIPLQLGNLPVLNYLDLSGNILDGEIPTQLQNLKLDRLNLSNNQLSGSIPPMYKSDAYRTSFLNNPGLCGELAGLCPGLHPKDSHGRRRLSSLLLALIFVLGGIVLLVVGVGWFYFRYRKFKKAKLGSDKSKWTLTSFHKLGFSEYEILDCLDEDNVIGSGASGKVYKAVLSSGEAVAVKKLWGNARSVDKAEADAFKAEVATLGKIRHKNIVKLWCTCSHKECKLLVYEYMPNGSLGDLLHSGKAGALDWPTRYKIALDAAEGLSYLHHDCVPAIVHRDIKSNNILLDADFGARVADFGVAKAMEDALEKGGPKSMSVIAGSCGYIAPEYAYTLRVTEKSDIYSFGVVILELVTGKRPIEPEFGEKDLVKWVCGTLEQKGIIDHVVDTKLDLSLYREEISKVLNIGLLCTSSLPISRPSMRRIVKMLLELGEEEEDDAAKSKPKTNQQEQEHDEKLTPYYFEEEIKAGSDTRT